MHPITKKPVVYISDWDGGMITLDFSIPQAPVRLAQWSDTGQDGGAVHSTRSIPEAWDGHHYVLVGQEFIARPHNRPSGWLYILDDTDPAKPKEVGRWTLPIDSEAKWNGEKAGGLETWSTHYFRVVNHTVFIAMYHAGVWALDISTPENLALPKSVGVFVPAKPTPAYVPAKNPYNLTPFVLDVFPNADSTMTIFDALSGVYTVHFDAEHPMAAPTPWPRDGQPHEDG